MKTQFSKSTFDPDFVEENGTQREIVYSDQAKIREYLKQILIEKTTNTIRTITNP